MEMASIEAILVDLPTLRPHHLAFASRHVQRCVVLRALVRQAIPVACKLAVNGERAIAQVGEMLKGRRHPVSKP